MNIKIVVLNTDVRQFMSIQQAQFSLVCSWHWDQQV